MEHHRFIATLTSPRLGDMSNIAGKIMDVKLVILFSLALKVKVVLSAIVSQNT